MDITDPLHGELTERPKHQETVLLKYVSELDLADFGRSQAPRGRGGGRGNVPPGEQSQVGAVVRTDRVSIISTQAGREAMGDIWCL